MPYGVVFSDQGDMVLGDIGFDDRAEAESELRYICPNRFIICRMPDMKGLSESAAIPRSGSSRPVASKAVAKNRLQAFKNASPWHWAGVDGQVS